MAARENQGLQAIVITLAILVLLLGVFLVLVNNNRSSQTDIAKAAKAKLSEQQTAASRAQEEANTYKEWNGFSREDGLEALRERYQEDMETFGGSFAEEDRNYRDILIQLQSDYEKMTQDESTAKSQLAQLKITLLAAEAGKEKQVIEFQKQLEAAKSDLVALRAKFNDETNRIVNGNREYEDKLKEMQSEYDNRLAKLNATLKKREDKVRKLDRANVVLKSNQRVVDPFLEPADGHVTWVNQRYDKAWINLGSEDGLRPQVTFSVYAPGEADVSKAEKKGTIEVINVDGRTAECRISSVKNTDPVMPGDKIFSQVWDRGRKIGFAFTGFIDIDNDKVSDADLLKRIVESSNGKIDASPSAYNEDAQYVQGELDVTTRYLVLGDRPSGADEKAIFLASAWDEMNEDADSLGIETIPLDQFISLMGWQRENRAVGLGAGARSSDFPATPATQELPRKTRQPEGVFRKRLPSISY